MDEFSLQKANRFQCEQVVDQEGVGVFQRTDDAPTTQDRGDACLYRLSEGWILQVEWKNFTGDKFTCGHQHVLVKHCLLYNFPAAPPSLLLLPHCQMSNTTVENSCMDII